MQKKIKNNLIKFMRGVPGISADKVKRYFNCVE